MRTINPENYRNYQVEARDAVFGDFEAGLDSSLVVMPTGTGKTVLAGMCVEAARSMGRRTLFLAHREILINQAYKTMGYFGLDAAVEMGENNALAHVATFGAPDVVVGSVQTFQADRLMRWPADWWDYIIIDECHRALADSYTKILNWFGGYKLLGITATPKRGDERNLGARFQKKSYEYKLRRAIEEQWLVPIRTRTCPTSVNLRGIKVSGGDFSVGELEERIGPMIEQLARGFAKEIGGRPAVYFAPDVGSAMAFAQVLNDIGVSARYVAGTGGRFGMPKGERNVNLEAYDAGEYQVIVCNELLVEGWDCHRVEAVGVGRPTLQQYRYMQMVGRGTRPSPDTGKTDCLVVDFDWETDDECKDLCTTVDLFNDGSVNEEVFAVARGLAKERMVDADPLEVIEEAERIVRTRQRFRIRLTGKEDQYAAWEHDPVGVAKILDIKLNRKYDLDKQGNNPASSAQVGMLRGLGIRAPEGLSKWGASKMIDKLLKRKADGGSSAVQVQTLLANGVDPGMARTMSFNDAKGAIVEIDAYNRHKPKSHTTNQRSLFS
jgi:superfamily II DNA or RNA helicase